MKTEYQTGYMTFESIESGAFNELIQARSSKGWTLQSTTRYFSKQHDQDCLLYVLERQVMGRM